MSIRCRFGRHEAESRIRWNDGYYVTRCERCGIDLIGRTRGNWRPVPKGYRIVWKPKPANYPDWNGFARPFRADPIPSASPMPAQGEVRLRVVPSAPAETEAEPIPSFREWQRRAASR